MFEQLPVKGSRQKEASSVLRKSRSASADGESNSVVATTTEFIYNRGRPVPVTGIHVASKCLIFQGRFVRVARLKDEWYDDVGDPEVIIKALKTGSPRPDIFTFWQRLPDIEPVHSYYYENEALSAVPLKDFEHWWRQQIRTDTRKKAKRAEKRGIEIRIVELDDDFVRGVSGVFNETPIRRGRRFWHYGKDFDTLKAGLSRDLDKSKFIGAYDNGELVGFVKLVCADGRFANPGLIVSKLAYRNKYVNNALLAKSVEVCTQDQIPYLTYTNWRRGTQAEFLVRHGFQKVFIPRYWVPLTSKGAIAIKLGLHRNVRSYTPGPLLDLLRRLRAAFYTTRYGGSAEEGD
jgi:hypothetical protein